MWLPHRSLRYREMSLKYQFWGNVNLRTSILENICEQLLLIFLRYPWHVWVEKSHLNIKWYYFLQAILLLLFETFCKLTSDLFCKLPTNKIIVILNNKCYMNTKCVFRCFLLYLFWLFKLIGLSIVEKWICQKPIRDLIW